VDAGFCKPPVDHSVVGAALPIEAWSALAEPIYRPVAAFVDPSDYGHPDEQENFPSLDSWHHNVDR
jgi:hypothetical protein